MRALGYALIQPDQYSYEKRLGDFDTKCVHIQRDRHAKKHEDTGHPLA